MTEAKSPSEIAFVDTNIWLYAFIEGQDAIKSEVARQLLRSQQELLVVSSQVINEICVNLLRKAHVPEADVQQLIHSFYQRYPVVLLDQPVQISASQFRERFSLSFWDSLILAAAIYSGATVLYSEDMQANLEVGGHLTIRNPFAS
jgi:predicted nucleic acid-binding protein